MSDYSELKMLAEKATPGPWHVDSHGMTMTSTKSFKTVFNHPTDRPAVRHEETGNLSSWRNDWDASFIATANPAAVLEMIHEIEVLREENEKLNSDNKSMRGLIRKRHKQHQSRKQTLRHMAKKVEQK